MMRILPASSRCDSSSSMHIASSGPTAAYPRKMPWLSIGLSRVSTDCTRYREPFVSTTNASSCGISLPLLRELLEVLDGLPVVLHRDLDVRLDEVPRAREVPVSEAVPLPQRPAVVDLRLVEEVDLLQLVEVGVHGRLRVRLRVVPFRKVADLLQEEAGDVVQVLQGRERRVAHDVDLEAHGYPIPAVASTRG